MSSAKFAASRDPRVGDDGRRGSIANQHAAWRLVHRQGDPKDPSGEPNRDPLNEAERVTAEPQALADVPQGPDGGATEVGGVELL